MVRRADSVSPPPAASRARSTPPPVVGIGCGPPPSQTAARSSPAGPGTKRSAQSGCTVSAYRPHGRKMSVARRGLRDLVEGVSRAGRKEGARSPHGIRRLVVRREGLRRG
eukprot:763300-Prorocentrum_minimum.AAC.1